MKKISNIVLLNFNKDKFCLFTITKIFLVIFIVMPIELGSAPHIIIKKEKEIYPIGLNLDILEDINGKLTIDNVSSDKFSNKFIPSQNEKPGFGFTDSIYWIRFTINAEKNIHKKWYLELAYPLMDKIELYTPNKDKGFINEKAGYAYPFNNRKVKNRNFVFNLKIKNKLVNTYYMRFENKDRMEMPLTLWTKKAFLDNNHTEQYILGIYYGIIFVMILYNFMLFISIRDKSFLFYVLYISFFCLFQLTQNGFAYEYYWPHSLSSYNHYIPGSVLLLLFFSILFSQSYLNTIINTPKTHKFLNILRVFSILFLILSIIISYSLSILIGSFLALTTITTIIITSIICLRKKYRPATFFVIAVSAIMLGAIVFTLKIIAVLPNNFFTSNAIQIGSVIEVVLLSLGLGDKINILKNENEFAQQAAIANLKETSIKNRKIEELNKELKKNIDNLKEANIKISISEKKYKLLVEGSNEIFFSLDDNFNFLTVNKSIKTHLKINPKKLISKNFLDIVSNDENKLLGFKFVQDKLKEFKENYNPIRFKAEFETPKIEEPKEMQISLEYINFEGKNEIIGKASNLIEDSLLKYFVNEKQAYSLKNYLFGATEISQRMTRNLSLFLNPNDVNNIRLAIFEIIINAIEHGNLGITFEEKTEAMLNGNYFDFLAKRLNDPENNKKRILVEFSINKEKAVYRISDQGIGFDHKKLFKEEIDSSNKKMLAHGRGISLTRQIFDKVKYNSKGNKVLLLKLLS
jgi:PAS domain-containing protein